LIPERRWQAASAFAQYSIVLIKAQVFGAVDGDDEVVRVFTQGTLMRSDDEASRNICGFNREAETATR
jgi:hypothetical protein